jgi:hypothetical protein
MVILFTVSLAVMRLPAIRLLPLVSADITVRGRGGIHHQRGRYRRQGKREIVLQGKTEGRDRERRNSSGKERIWSDKKRKDKKRGDIIERHTWERKNKKGKEIEGKNRSDKKRDRNN